MPSNPYSEQKKCFNRINLLLTSLIKSNKEGFVYDDVLRDLLITYAVSQSMIEKYIIRFYIEAGLVTLKEGVLKYKK